jgi:hypothetical protein
VKYAWGEEFIVAFGGRARRKGTTRKSKHRWRIILKWILDKWDGAVWTRFIWLRLGTCGGLL